MADYWKSNPRHYCKYCDCWIADNKPSKDFHERGKKHQEMVKKKIDEIKKKTRENEKADKEMENIMKKIEKKAKASFQKDLEVNPILQRAMLEKKKQQEAEEASIPPPVQGCAPPPKELKEQKPGSWKILFSDEGYPYFWNQETNEVQWTKPDDYVPEHENRFGQLDEAAAGASSSQESKDPSLAAPEPTASEPTAPEPTAPEPTASEPTAPEPTAQEQDPLPLLPTHEIPLPPPPGTEKPPVQAKVQDPATPNDSAPEVDKADRKRPMPSNKAYGGWEQMKEPTEEEQVDLQLPEVEKAETQVIVSNVKEPKIKFRTKTVNPIAEGLAAFKKRKISQGARNIKKREDDR